jgi:23S rRNA (guanine2445-N2)-methyltransferase / 23S rRNA (guanine2069-N7)-methyltransferase
MSSAPSDSHHSLIATTAFGLEAVVVRELRQLGFDPKVVGVGRVLFQADTAAICRANLWLRAADRVLICVGRFMATDFGQLFDGVRELPWAEWLPADAAFPVSGRSIDSQLSSVPACQKIVKKAVVENLRAAHGTQVLDESGPRYSLEVAMLKDEATLTIDTTGPSLHKRGYGRAVGPSPLKETLAAAMVMLSFWRAGRPLIDPFCGSGTIAIEAAMLGRCMAPGLQRAFAAEDWPVFDRDCWERMREAARDSMASPLEARILATDTSAKAVSLARHHAERAGVADDIHFQQKDFADLSSKREYGCVISNPPYGIRMGEAGQVRELYESIPLVLRRLPTWSHYLLSASPELERLAGRKADRRRKLYNGRIQCTLYQFYGPKPPGTRRESEDSAASPAPAFGGVTSKAHEQAELFGRRLAKRARHLRRWPTKQGITCFRIYDRDIPEIPLAVDRYEDYLHIAEYERPHDRDPAQHADWVDLMVRAAARVLDVPRQRVFVKYRQPQRGKSQYERRGSAGSTLLAQEGGLQFRVNLSDYVDTGLFLDHRTTRSMVRGVAAGTRFINLFGYTGSFTVYAAAGGAASTATVDWSATYLDWAQENMRLNGFVDPRHCFVREDAARYLQRLPVRELFDLAVVDPPTYSNSKRADFDWDVQRDHATLLNELLIRMPAGGTIFFSTNFRRFKLDEHGVQAASVREISKQTVPEDFRNRRIHRCWRLVKA